jgi:hypothetical protein
MAEANGRRVGSPHLPAGLVSVNAPKRETMVASDIRLAVGDRARCISLVRAALVFILTLAAMSAQAGQAPRRATMSRDPDRARPWQRRWFW